jgi:predicted ATPase
MLTRLEANNFKNLIGFSTDFGAFTCLAGPNAVGKSNVLDAIRFLSLLADHTLMDAALAVRGADRDTTDLVDLFWTDGRCPSSSFSLAAEMLVDENVIDEFGRPAKASSTFLRYEIEIGYEAPGPNGALGRLVLLAERLNYLTEEKAASRLVFPHSAKEFRQHAVVNRRRTAGGFISTEKAGDGKTEIYIHQDGGSRGKPQKAPAATAPRTIVATSNTSATPTILAARREMQKWRLLALEASSMRNADRFHGDPHVSPHGDHLAATLYRLGVAAQKNGGSTAQVYARIASRLSDFVPVTEVKPVRDDIRQLITLEVKEGSGTTLPARSLSDGTLRFLTLTILGEDPDADGLICMEEPENGIHPAKMSAMVKLLYELAVDVQKRPSTENPMRQVIVATHSPILVQLVKKDDLLFAVGATVASETGTPASTLRLRPLKGTWRAKAPSEDPGVGLGTIIAYLTSPPGAQIRIDDLNPEFSRAADA